MQVLHAGYVFEPNCNTAQEPDPRYRLPSSMTPNAESDFVGLFRDWFKAIGNDPINKRFGEDWARLTQALLFHSEGSLKV